MKRIKLQRSSELGRMDRRVESKLSSDAKEKNSQSLLTDVEELGLKEENMVNDNF